MQAAHKMTSRDSNTFESITEAHRPTSVTTGPDQTEHNLDMVGPGSGLCSQDP